MPPKLPDTAKKKEWCWKEKPKAPEAMVGFLWTQTTFRRLCSDIAAQYIYQHMGPKDPFNFTKKTKGSVLAIFFFVVYIIPQIPFPTKSANQHLQLEVALRSGFAKLDWSHNADFIDTILSMYIWLNLEIYVCQLCNKIRPLGLFEIIAFYCLIWQTAQTICNFGSFE